MPQKSNNEDNIDVDKVVKHWLQTSDEDFNTMKALVDNKSYSWALFLGHITLEKLLKALFVRKYNKHAPFTHNLYRLAELSELDFLMNLQIGLMLLPLLI